jgi:cation transport regulator ChaC
MSVTSALVVPPEWGITSSSLRAGGTVEAPEVFGVVYHIPAASAEAEMKKLLHREQAGYDCVEVGVACSDGATRRALTFIATPTNEYWVGPPAPALEATGAAVTHVDTREPWSISALADVIASSVGPSGPNREYLYRLVDTLTSHGAHDAYLDRLVAAVQVSGAAREAP